MYACAERDMSQVQVDVATTAPNALALYDSDTEEDLKNALFVLPCQLDVLQDGDTAPPVAAAPTPSTQARGHGASTQSTQGTKRTRGSI